MADSGALPSSRSSSGPSSGLSSVELEQIRALVQPLADQLAAEGHRLYLVGGVVRDLLLADDGGQHLDEGGGATTATGLDAPHLFHDIDLTTDARPNVIKRVLQPAADAIWTQGERFGTIGAQIAGRSFEVTTHRAESYDPTSRKPVVSFGDDLATDLSRRDFTINAIAIDALDGALHDPFGGRADLERRYLRTPLDPEISFTDDPLRMLRAARFIPRFGLDVDADLQEAAVRLADRLEIVSDERVHDEFERLLTLPAPAAGLEFLLSTGLLDHLVPQLHESGAEAVARASTATTPLVRRAALLWTLGPEGAADWMSARRYPNADRSTTTQIMRAAVEIQASGRAGAIRPRLRRAAHRLGNDGLDELVHLLDVVDVGETSTDLRQALATLRAIEDLDDLEPPLEGTAVMRLLEIEPGPQIGAALAYLAEERIERGPFDAGEAVRLLHSWWADRPDGP